MFILENTFFLRNYYFLIIDLLNFFNFLLLKKRNFYIYYALAKLFNFMRIYQFFRI